MSGIDKYLEQLWQGDFVTEQIFKEVFYPKAKEVLLAEKNVVSIALPVTICGDLHGQFPDLLELFRVGGRVPETNYIFMGDFVDRGVNGIEVFQLLLALKIRYPKRITLLRGNHETRQISQTYGFYEECLKKFGSPEMWKMCCDLFDMLSLSAVIDGKIVCVHGGLSPEIKTIDDIAKLDRLHEAPASGSMCDLMWSDPDNDVETWKPSIRGAGYLFGQKAVDEFLLVNKLDFVARAHQIVMEGFEWKLNNKVCTVWSAPNYCYRCGNRASVLQLDDTCNQTFMLFDAAPESERNRTAHQASSKMFSVFNSFVD
ncbi:serine/threonine protein phosphatase 4 catalytic subunit, putative [Entamoeba invadens IP1]|uniref:Serine/threonine-protein phosphatase n=1 Tax=Entamoeba invadens IP1 TaxID=370355 RepID=A0A0A1TYP1_ENTIV|nr:serine/threonine protein phosphatase 4 catalytic subunit, putative [Entamoeba invadens IP1]ELP86604.1 serine/threonine protein phosphatase 4 catalytic subunit, putative [Entamoeba invadens IP1]|eukprot:XP_004185950.1 serine/threonine protein phosphatase 4 catalytic subunit, putative [Entamoeba invadens IP1]